MHSNSQRSVLSSFICAHLLPFHTKDKNSVVDILYGANVLLFFLCFLPGKILSDDKPLKEYNISDKNFVVVMATKVHSIAGFFFIIYMYFTGGIVNVNW